MYPATFLVKLGYPVAPPSLHRAALVPYKYVQYSCSYYAKGIRNCNLQRQWNAVGHSRFCNCMDSCYSVPGRSNIQGRLIVPPMTAVEALLCRAEVFSDHR